MASRALVLGAASVLTCALGGVMDLTTGLWLLGEDGEACSEACGRYGGVCSEKHWPKSGEELRAIAEDMDHACEDVQEGTVRYDPSVAGIFCGWKGESEYQNRCGAKPPWSTRRFCYCDGAHATSAEPFTCDDDGHADVDRVWSAHKKQWCCLHRGQGCPATTTTLTTTALFNCDAGFENFENGWSEAKKQWCCKYKGRSCPLPPGATTTIAPFDCSAGQRNWVKGWSDVKQAWCCKREDIACPFDCEAGFSNWEAGWSDHKKQWCCKHANRGCS
mmetsp:Transcript_99984/g.283179  ORF Transcript_99984/g.283179 Transcript_99984/m.283179 type:complete len:275 (-) Transcript_99984:211-1035(-)